MRFRGDLRRHVGREIRIELDRGGVGSLRFGDGKRKVGGTRYRLHPGHLAWHASGRHLDGSRIGKEMRACHQCGVVHIRPCDFADQARTRQVAQCAQVIRHIPDCRHPAIKIAPQHGLRLPAVGRRGKVDVRVDQTGHQIAPVQIDHRGPGQQVRRKLAIRQDAHDALASDQHVRIGTRRLTRAVDQGGMSVQDQSVASGRSERGRCASLRQGRPGTNGDDKHPRDPRHLQWHKPSPSEIFQRRDGRWTGYRRAVWTDRMTSCRVPASSIERPRYRIREAVSSGCLHRVGLHLAFPRSAFIATPPRAYRSPLHRLDRFAELG